MRSQARHHPRPRSRGVGDPRAAVALLTRIPVGHTGAADPAGAVGWFPAVGLLVAVVSMAARAVLEPVLGPATATTAAVLVGVVITGALHEDGLADSVDGLWGGTTPERRLEIMRDSRIGTYGVIALVGELALRSTLLASVGLDGFVRAVVTADVLGRLAPLVLAAWLAPARDDGQGAHLRPASIVGWTLAATTALAATVASTGMWTAALVATAALTTWTVGRIARVRIGGVTGDVFGAGICLNRLALSAVVVTLTKAGAW